MLTATPVLPTRCGHRGGDAAPCPGSREGKGIFLKGFYIQNLFGFAGKKHWCSPAIAGVCGGADPARLPTPPDASLHLFFTCERMERRFPSPLPRRLLEANPGSLVFLQSS